MVRSHIKQLKYFPAAKNNAQPAMHWPKKSTTAAAAAATLKIQKHDASTILYNVQVPCNILAKVTLGLHD